jgi:hypothetical protein
MQIDRIRVKLLPCRFVLLCLSDDIRPRDLPEHVLVSHGKFERGHDDVEMTGLDEIVTQVTTTLLIAIVHYFRDTGEPTIALVLPWDNRCTQQGKQVSKQRKSSAADDSVRAEP